MSPLHSSEVAALDRAGTAASATDARAGRTAAAFVPAVVALVTLAVFSPALDNDFVEWDDGVLITKNAHYRGLGWAQLSWMFSTVMMGHYVPVTWLSLGLDYLLWGMDPAGYHFTNLLLHAANATLFYFLALRLLRAATVFPDSTLRVASAVSALFFALHPLRAESVAWITERRDVLSGFFFFLTLVLYLQARDLAGAARVRRHAAAGLCYLFAILSKSMVMTLPALLVLLDVYPFRRLGRRGRSWLAADVWREKIPYIALGLLAALLGYYAQAVNRFITSLDQVPWFARPALVTHSLWFYVSKTLLPLNLSPLYELPSRVELLHPRFLVPTLVVALITVGLAVLGRRWPAGLAAWAAYALLLAPVTGVVHSGHQLTHDRYSYLSCLAWALLVGAGAGSVLAARVRGALRPAFATLAGAVGLAWLGALGFLTWHQVGAWRDNETLWRYAVESTPECSVCKLNLGTALLNQNQLGLALGQFERAIAERPDRAKAHANLGLAFARQGDIERAVEHFRRATREGPDDASALMNLGVSMMKLGRHAEGAVHLRRAIAIKPDDVLILANLGAALVETGRPEDAIVLLRRAIELEPGASLARYALVSALVAAGDAESARREHAFLRVIDPAAANFIGPALLGAW